MPISCTIPITAIGDFSASNFCFVFSIFIWLSTMTACPFIESLVSSVQAGLEIFVRTERPMVMTRFPREHFAQEQHCLVAIDYYERINRKRLNFLDIREDLGNLACLHEYFIGRDDRAAAVAARLLHKLLQIMSEFAMRIEHNSRMRKTNWQAVVDMYAAILQDPDANATYVILPKLRHIFQLRLMG